MSKDPETRFEDIQNRLSIADTWSGRIEKLVNKRLKKDPSYSEAKFCEKYKFDKGFFNRVKNVKVIPTQKTVNKIEAALKKERV